MTGVTGKICVITGASTGIGEATARALAARGAAVVLAARRGERLETIAEEIRARGGRAMPVPCDVGRVADLEGLASRVESALGRCDVLINSAGIPGGGAFAELTLSQIERVTAVDYLGVLRCTKLFLPMLLRARGHLVNVASIAGRHALPGASVYAAAKHAVVALSESLYHELAPRGVMVTVVNPGAVATEGFPHTEMLRDPRLRWFVMDTGPTVRAIVRAISRRRGPEVSVPRWLGALEAGRVLAPPVYRMAVRRLSRFRTPSLEADPD